MPIVEEEQKKPEPPKGLDPKNLKQLDKNLSDKKIIKSRSEDFQRFRREPKISDKYRAGPFLIYDCKDRHFACVNDLSFTNCQKARAESKEQRLFILSCAPLKEFRNQDECFKYQYQKVYARVDKRFCRNPKSFRY